MGGALAIGIAPAGVVQPVRLSLRCRSFTRLANLVQAATAGDHACFVEDSRDYRKLLDQSIEWLKQCGIAAEGFLATGNTWIK